jgi:hypothetical protein
MVWFTGVAAIVIGLALCFWGYKLFRFFLGAAGLLAGAGIGYFLGEKFLPAGIWPLAAAAVLGLALAVFAYSLFKTGAVIIGAFLGAMLLHMVLGAAHTQTDWWVYLIGAVAGAVLASIFLKPFLIIGSAFEGAYMTAAGAYSLILMKDMVLQGSILPNVQAYPWYIFAAVLLLTVLGTAVQFGKGKGHIRGIG